MKKISLFIIVVSIVSSCTSTWYQTIEIIWMDTTNDQISVRGMGVILDNASVITSAHVVRDDQLRYSIQWEVYAIVQREVAGDRALLSQKNNNTDFPWTIGWFPQVVSTWSLIYSQVMRSGKIQTLTGKVISPYDSILGYDSLWRITTLSGIVITDIEYFPWDSGAGIFDSRGKLIDVVHVK